MYIFGKYPDLIKYINNGTADLCMKRRVIKHGPSTYTISLPSKWVKQHNIKKGDELDLNMLGPMLQVYTHTVNDGSTYEADISQLSPDMAKRLLGSLHKNGYDTLNLQCTPAQLPHIQKRINTMLLDYEIINIKDNKCMIKAISQSTEQSFKPIFRRLFLVTIALAEGVADLTKKQEFEKLADLLSLEETNNKLTNYIHRLITKHYLSQDKLCYMYVISWVLESIADEYKEICTLLKDETKIGSSCAATFEEMQKLIHGLYELFYNFEFPKVEQLLTQTKSIKEHIQIELEQKRKKHEVETLFALNAIQRYVEHSIGSVIAYHN